MCSDADINHVARAIKHRGLLGAEVRPVQRGAVIDVMVYKDDVIEVRVTIAPAGTLTQMHTHTEQEAIYTCSGKWQLYGDDSCTYYPESICIVPKGVEHGREILEDCRTISILRRRDP